MRLIRPGRRRQAPASLSQNDRDRIVAALLDVRYAAEHEYVRADQEGRQHLWLILEQIGEALKRLGVL